MKEMLNNPIVRMFFNTQFKGYLKENQIDGIYLTLDKGGNIAAIDFKTKPKNENE